MHTLNQYQITHVGAGDSTKTNNHSTFYQYISGEKLGSWFIGQDCSSQSLSLQHPVCIASFFAVTFITIDLPIVLTTVLLGKALNKCRNNNTHSD